MAEMILAALAMAATAIAAGAAAAAATTAVAIAAKPATYARICAYVGLTATTAMKG